MVSHVEDEELALIALGESVSAADEAHLATCPHCQSRVDQLRAVVSSARSIEPADRPVTPPDSVWQAITAELAADQPAPSDELAERRAQRRPRRWLVVAAAAAVGLLVGAGLTSIIRTTSTDVIVATAVLNPIGDSGVAGTATIARAGDGSVLNIEVPGLENAQDGYYEVWMATADTKTMVALGTLNPGTPGTFSLPSGMDPDAFPVVDVSLEHFDGDAGHSATSIVRGQLAT
jgi:hypothetical protein